jgi:hypothetical protein
MPRNSPMGRYDAVASNASVAHLRPMLGRRVPRAVAV